MEGFDQIESNEPNNLINKYSKIEYKDNILVTGTPGVGKTSLAILLADEFKNTLNKEFKVLNLGELVLKKKLYDNWNKDFDVPEFNESKIIEELEYLNDGGYIIDFHSACFLPEEWFKLIVILRCNNTELYDRLKGRGYNEKKITENIECEIMEMISDEVKENFDTSRILEVSNEKIEDMSININKIIEIYKNL